MVRSGACGVDLAGVQVVDHPLAVAYCLPGIRSRIVVSRGAIDALADSQLRAVLAHERAHAHSRHDLVVQPFIAWRATFPFLPTATTALRAVELLVEMLADDRARRSSAPSHLQEALGQLASRHSALVLSHDQLTTQVAARTARLTTPPQSLPRLLGPGHLPHGNSPSCRSSHRPAPRLTGRASDKPGTGAGTVVAIEQGYACAAARHRGTIVQPNAIRLRPTAICPDLRVQDPKGRA